MTVPELSLKAYTHGDAAQRAQFSDALMHGLQDYGFFTLKDHNVDAGLLDRAYDLAIQTFSQPEIVKRQGMGGLRGYTPFGVEHAKNSHLPDLKEFWQIGREPLVHVQVDEDLPPNVWPDVPGFRETFLALYDALDETGRILLRALAPKLDLPEDYFDPLVRDGTSILRVLHYPPVADDVPVGAVRSAAHEDINFMTILVAARGAGLQLLDRDGTWLPVETEARNLIVDSGDMLERLTNGVIPSTTHRVVNPEGPNVARYSMPFFMHPSSSVSLKALPSCAANGPARPEITAGAFLDERLKAIGLAS
jgi:isopenicillin N synthase-like dioxygenase